MSDVVVQAVQPAIETYRRRLAELDEQIADDQNRDRIYGIARLLTFVAAILFLILGYSDNGMAGVVWLGWICVAAFLGVVIANEPSRLRIEAAKLRQKVYNLLIARCQRDWRTIAKQGSRHDSSSDLSVDQKAAAGDLDLFGDAGLFALVCLAGTEVGRHRLADWIGKPCDAPESEQRGQWSAAIVGKRAERIDFYELVGIVGGSTGSPTALQKWASGPAWLQSRPWLPIWSVVSIVICVVCLAVLICRGLLGTFVDQTGWAFLAIGSVMVINLFLSMVVLSPMHQIFSIAMSNRRSVQQYQRLFAAADWMMDPATVDNALVQRTRETIFDNQIGAQAGLAQLDRIAAAGSLRSSAATFLIYLPLQLIGLYDIWVLAKLEQWQQKHRDHVAGWFAALGSMEAVASTAALRDENPDWASAEFVAADTPDTAIVATSLGHPLLRDDSRVSNDVQIGPPGKLLLVTGSNMSGKSTMLRSVGLNIALARAGGPVCADSMSLPAVEMATSIRVTDDLSQGVSFYMAELKRLKRVVDQATRLQSNSQRVCLFLLDEILQGTNSRERQIAVTKVLDRLVDSGAIGAITTHDLELADDARLMARSDTVHFRETIRPGAGGGDEMTFDYQMHPGVCPTTNALRLLELVGL